MAKCPACSRKVSLKALVQQSAFRKYRCMRCGRTWRFSQTSLITSLLPAVAAGAFVGLGFLFEIQGYWAEAVLGLFVFALVYCFSLVVMGRLKPATGFKSN
jgi:DNA-directed RNA polymerase subunit RPC12/RpoP